MEECTCDETHSPVSVENLGQPPEEDVEEDKCHVVEDQGLSGGIDEAVYHRPLDEEEEEEIVSTSRDMMGSHLDGECPLSTSPSSEDRITQNKAPSSEEKVGGGEKTNRKKDGSFVPRTMFNFDPEPPIPPKNQTKKKMKKKVRQPKEAVPTESVEPQAPLSIFSQTTMKYLKSSGLHSKRIENLLMKYLGPTTPSSQQDPV